MASLREIIYDIKEMFNVYSSSSVLSDEHLAFQINNKRSANLRNYMSNLKKEIPMQAKQLICMQLTEDLDCDDDFVFLRSIKKIPSTLEATGRSNITEAYLRSRVAKWINVIDYARLPYLKGGRFNSKQIYITIDPQDHVIVYSRSGNHELIDDIKLNIVAENPEEAYEMACDKDQTCDFYDSPYPMEGGMVDVIKKEILNELLIKYRVPVDINNNAQDDNISNANLDDRRRRRSDYAD